MVDGMEKVKEALEKARDQREQALDEAETIVAGQLETGSRLGSDRILDREPFRRYSKAEQQRLVETGRVVNVGAGETLQFAGDKDAYVHYLLSGAVVVETDNEAKTVSADQDDAERPLDWAGVKAHTIMAASDAEVLRVPYTSLPGRIDSSDARPIPTEAYDDTYSGQKLATLVEQVNKENAALDAEREYGIKTGSQERDATETSLNALSDSADSMLADLEFMREDEDPDNREVGYVPTIDDEIGRFTRQLEQQFRGYVEQVRKEERARYETQLQRHSERLQKVAAKQIRESLSKQRARYQAAYAEKEQTLRSRYKNLRDFANKIARQKAAIYAARRQIREKLQMVEQIHSELSQLGSQLNHEFDDLDDMMPNNKPDTASA